MTYNTPALLLVGAANHLVLGNSEPDKCPLSIDNPTVGPFYQETNDW